MLNLFGRSKERSNDGFSGGPPPGLLVDDDEKDTRGWKADSHGRDSRTAPSSERRQTPGGPVSANAAPSGLSEAFSESAAAYPEGRSSSPKKHHGERRSGSGKSKKHKHGRRSEESSEAFPPDQIRDPSMNGARQGMAGGMQGPSMMYGMPGANDWAGNYEWTPPSDPPLSPGLSPAHSDTEHRRHHHRHGKRSEKTEMAYSEGYPMPNVGDAYAAPLSPGPGGNQEAHQHRAHHHHRHHGMEGTPPGPEAVAPGNMTPRGAAIAEGPMGPGQGTPVAPYTPGSGQSGLAMPDIQWAYSQPGAGQHPGMATSPMPYDPSVSTRVWSTPASVGGENGTMHGEVPLSWAAPQVDGVQLAHPGDGFGVPQQNDFQQAQVDDVLQGFWVPAVPSHPNGMIAAAPRDPQSDFIKSASTMPELATAPARVMNVQQAGKLDLDWARAYSSTKTSGEADKAEELDLSWATPRATMPGPKAAAFEDPLIWAGIAGSQVPSSVKSDHRVPLGSVDGGDDQEKDQIIDQLQDEFRKLRDKQRDDLIQQLQEEMRKKEQQHKETVTKLQDSLRIKEHQNAALVEKMQGEIMLREQKNQTMLAHLQAAIKDREDRHSVHVEDLQAEIRRLQQQQKDALVEHLHEEIDKLKKEVLAPRSAPQLIMGTVLRPSDVSEPPAMAGAPAAAAVPSPLPAPPAGAALSQQSPDMAAAWPTPGAVAKEQDTAPLPDFGQPAGLKRWPSFGADDDASFRTEPPWMLDRGSLARYQRTFLQADRDGDGFVEGEEAREVLDKTSLPAEELARIWFLADTDQDGRLAWGEFLCAMHIASRRAQEGIPLPDVLPAELAMHLGTPAPTSLISEDSPSSVVGASTGPAASDSGLDWIGIAESSPSNGASMAWGVDGFAQEPAQAQLPPMSGLAQPPEIAEPVFPENASPWAVSPEEAQRYSAIFHSEADAHGTGFAGAMEAKEVLEQSNLPVADLSTIWQVSDMDGDARLNLVEFACAMALVARRLQGAPLPSAPPPELLASLAAAGLHGGAALAEQQAAMSPKLEPPARAPATGSWEPTPEELERFQVVYESLCGAAVGGNGVLGAEEGRELFERSGLSLDDLSHIWRISDLDCDGQLAPGELICALTLVARRRQGAPLPPELPPELAQKLRPM